MEVGHVEITKETCVYQIYIYIYIYKINAGWFLYQLYFMIIVYSFFQ